MNITGTHIYEYFKCKRQLYLNILDINTNLYNFNENVKIGKIVEQETYKRRSKKKKQYNIGVGIVDYIDYKDKVIYETKKSSKMIELAQWQVKFYLKHLGKEWKCIIEVPKENKKFLVNINEDDIETIEEAEIFIKSINNESTIPLPINSKICKNCSFYNYCYI